MERSAFIGTFLSAYNMCKTSRILLSINLGPLKNLSIEENNFF